MRHNKHIKGQFYWTESVGYILIKGQHAVRKEKGLHGPNFMFVFNGHKILIHFLQLQKSFTYTAIKALNFTASLFQNVVYFIITHRLKGGGGALLAVIAIIQPDLPPGIL